MRRKLVIVESQSLLMEPRDQSKAPADYYVGTVVHLFQMDETAPSLALEVRGESPGVKVGGGGEI